MAVDGPPPGPPAGAAPSLPSEPSGGRHIGSYWLQRELGRGGMGAVYLAEHELTHEKVAMKELVITRAADPLAVQRFLQEGEVMSRLTHPNIVGVRDIIKVGAGHFIAFEFVSGGSLRDLLDGEPLPAPQAFAVMHGLLQALDHAHRHGIVHRDVKPENVMLSTQGEVKVADFGIARLTDESAAGHATRMGTTVGTPQYMSPEQVTTRTVDGRSDLYSAGIVCYEVFCGRPPFEATAAEGPRILFAKHVQAPPPPPSVIQPGLDPALETIILESLSKRPEDRFQTASEFDRELSTIAGRICGPNWIHSLEPGADLTAMLPLARPGIAPKGVPDRGSAAEPWVPLRPAGQAAPNRVLIGGVVAAVLVAGLVIAYLAFGNGPTTSAVTPKVAIPSNPAAGPCDFLQAGQAPATGSGGACGLMLGEQVQADSFATLTALPGDLSPAAIDGNEVAKGKAMVSVSGGFAILNAPSQGSGVVLTTAATPADEVVIADFQPTTAGDANIGVGVRCSATACVLVYLSPKGNVWITERAGSGVPVQKFSDVVALQLNQVNRLVVAIRGARVQAWLNGNLISSVAVEVAGPGSVGFFNANLGTTPSIINLTKLYVFAPG